MKRMGNAGRRMPARLKAYLASAEIRELGNGDLEELMEDHGQLTKAIVYWQERSRERVQEFEVLLEEIEMEMMELVVNRLKE